MLIKVYFLPRDHPFMTSTPKRVDRKWTGVGGGGVMSSVDVHTVYTKIYKFISLYTSLPQVMLLKVVLQIVNSIVSRMLMRYVARYCPAPFIRNMLFTTET